MLRLCKTCDTREIWRKSSQIWKTNTHEMDDILYYSMFELMLCLMIFKRNQTERGGWHSNENEENRSILANLVRAIKMLNS